MVSLHGGPDSGSAALDATGVQLQGALDSLFMYDGPLGYRKPDGGNGSVTLWAPTAQQVCRPGRPRPSSFPGGPAVRTFKRGDSRN